MRTKTRAEKQSHAYFSIGHQGFTKTTGTEYTSPYYEIEEREPKEIY